MADAHEEIFKAEPEGDTPPIETPTEPTEPTPEPVEGQSAVAPVVGPTQEPAKEPDTPAEEPPTEPPFQAWYQKAKALTKERDPALHDQIYDELKAERKPQVQEPAQQPEPAQPETDGDTDPYLEEVRKAVRETVRSEVTNVQREAQMFEAHKNETEAANDLATSFVETEMATDKTPEAIKAAGEEFVAVCNGVKSELNGLVRGDIMAHLGGPGKVLQLTIERLQNKAMRDHFTQKTVDAQKEGETKAITAALVAQPKPGALPEPTKLTESQQQLEDMKAVQGSPEAKKEVFG